MRQDTMLATVLRAPGQFGLEQVPVPSIGSDEALVRVAACGVCGSDLPRMLTKGAHQHPIIPGHEFSGHVIEVGSEVSRASVGDLVTVPPLVPCGRCGPCAGGMYGLCVDYGYFGSRRDGAYTSYVAVPEGNLLVVPDGVDSAAAALTDPAAIALHALYQTHIGPGARVAVVGAGGPIGLFAIQWAHLMGASEILGVEIRPEKHDLVELGGASKVVADAITAYEVAGSDGFDVVVECAGARQAVDLAAGLSGRRAEAVFIGIPTEDVLLSLSSYQRFLRHEVRLLGSWNSFSAPFPGRAWEASLEGFASGRLRWEFMVTHRLPMSEVPAMIRKMGEGLPSSKVLFEPED
jgi:L-iditol 2-dehydrogenase